MTTPNHPRWINGKKPNEMKRQQKSDYYEFQQYDQTEKALESLLIEAVDEDYNRPIRDKYTGYANMTLLTIITHIYKGYAITTQR